MRYYRSIEVNQAAYPSFARVSEAGNWERYRYGIHVWNADIHVQGPVMMTGDWERCEPDDIEGHIAMYKNSHA